MPLKNTKSDQTGPHASVSIPEGQADIFILRNRQGMEARITNYGGILMSLRVPDRNGVFENIVLGFDEPAGYCTPAYLKENPFLGAVVGRNANVIRQAKFPLDGRNIMLAKNFGEHNLHGGIKGFDKYLWKAAQWNSEDKQELHLSRTSPDGEEGFPGNLLVNLVYELNDQNELLFRIQAEADQETLINITQHSYFNLKGEGKGDVMDHELMIAADGYVEFDRELVPTGLIKKLAGTPMDFNSPALIGSRIREPFDQLKFSEGYDATYTLRPGFTGGAAAAASVWHPATGRFMELFTSLPGIQLYTANSLNENVKKNYTAWSAFCLEAQYFPDGPNHPDFRAGVFAAGEKFDHQTRFRFSVK